MNAMLPGTLVTARGLRWEILHAEPAGQQTRYRLRTQESALQGLEMDFLVPFETVEPLHTAFSPEAPARLKDWQLYHQAFLLDQTLGPDAFLAGQPGRLQIAPYQLVPVMRALHMSRPRLMLADSVGLGKTIQAGLAMVELIARRRAHRILVVSPAGPLLQQWRAEMRDRFGLNFTVVDRDALQQIRYASELGTNPFDHVPLGLVSVDFAKQEKILQDLERTTYDLVVIDEAHHCMRLGAAGDREDSQRRRLAEVLARQSDGLLLLTATPHDGYDAHFASLLELLDPSLVNGRGSLRGDRYRAHVIRRMKEHVLDPETHDEVFKKRLVEPRPVVFNDAGHPQFTAFQRAIIALIGPRLRRAVRARRYGDVLAFISLLKRSVSTVRACRLTLEAIARRFTELAHTGMEAQEARRQRLKNLQDYRRRLARQGALSFDEELDWALLEADDMASELFASGADDLVAVLERTGREARREGDRLKRTQETAVALQDLIGLAEAAEPEDPKLEALVSELAAIRAQEPKANVLVYTEYSDSQDAVLVALETARKAGRLAGEVLAISGADSEERRMQLTARFSDRDDLILVSTDATAEGLNLHRRCHHLIHLELPYNPNRMEQRNGRIDRYGQTHRPVIRYLYLDGTFEDHLLMKLLAKFEKQLETLSFMPDTLGMIAEPEAPETIKLLEGLAEDQLSLFHAIDPADTPRPTPENDAYRDLMAEIERTMTGRETAAMSHAWLAGAGLNAELDQLRDADRARGLGHRLSAVDLVTFVGQALEADGGDVQEQADGTLVMRLPGSWTHGLEDTPGFESAVRQLRVTRDERERDADGRSLAFLGRAHPLVRRALDRMRHLQFGGGRGYVDRRVSVVKGDGPALLYTFLGIMQSPQGREYERVLAVRLTADGKTAVMTEPQEWQDLTDISRAVSLHGHWDRHFASWAPSLEDVARRAAEQAFAELARQFEMQYRLDRESERQSLRQWLSARTLDLLGEPEAEAVTLFAAADVQELPAWRRHGDELDRLTAFASDIAQALANRREAETTVNLWRSRQADLERRMALSLPPAAPLGLLMIVPEDL